MDPNGIPNGIQNGIPNDVKIKIESVGAPPTAEVLNLNFDE